MIPRKLLEPDLREVPQSNSRVSRALCCVVHISAWVGSDEECGILLRGVFILGQGSHVTGNEIQGEVGQRVVGETDLDWLLEI